MTPKDQDLKEWLYLELLNHPTTDQMLETAKNGRIKCNCERCEL